MVKLLKKKKIKVKWEYLRVKFPTFFSSIFSLAIPYK